MGEAWLNCLLVYFFAWLINDGFGRGRSSRCFWFGNRSAVDVGQVEEERAAADAGAVIVGRVPFAAEVTAVSVDIPVVGDGGSGGIARNRHFRA